MATKVGALACQRQPYLRNLRVSVLSCSEVDGKQKDIKDPLFEVQLTDSPLFPEGGGQPCDRGWVDDMEVSDVYRRGDACVVRVPRPLTVGSEVSVKVDWEKRFDHMQHHSGQHLLTAVTEKELGFPTESWAMSHPTCYIQLPTRSIPGEDVQRVEDKCNEYIREKVPIVCNMYETRDDVPSTRSRGIPPDVTGPIRLIDIEGVDTCTCCGTHVESLHELQAMKLLHQEPKGNTTKLHFVCGNRALSMFSKMYERERALMKELGTNPDSLVSSVSRKGTELASYKKDIKKCRKELANLLSPIVKADAGTHFECSKDVPFFFYREDADAEFLTVVSEGMKEFIKEGRLIMLGCGKGEDGQFLIFGASDGVDRLQKIACEALSAKGGLSRGTFRGKGNMKHWGKLQKAACALNP